MLCGRALGAVNAFSPAPCVLVCARLRASVAVPPAMSKIRYHAQRVASLSEARFATCCVVCEGLLGQIPKETMQ
eukprot:5011676-Amphidinium_carterae.1